MADRPYLVPRLSSPDYIPVLVELCRRERIDLVFPLIDPDIPVLAANRAAIEATGARLGVVPLEAAAMAQDKWLTTGFFTRLGLPIPRSWLPGQLDPAQLEYPVFVKPRSGSAGKSAFKVNNAVELAFFLSYVRDPMIQEFVEGPEVTTDVYCDVEGVLLGVVSRRRIEVRWGEVAKGVTVRDDRIMDACSQVASALPAIGPITVQCIVRDGVPHFTEINARLGGGVPLGIAAGVDGPLWLLARAAGLPIEIPPLGAYRTGLYITRFDESTFLTDAERAEVPQMMKGHVAGDPV